MEVIEQENAMSDRTLREQLFESLEKNAREVAGWPAWMRSAISTEHVFNVSPPRSDEASVRRDDATECKARSK